MQNYDLKSLFPTFSVIEGVEFPAFEKMLKTQFDMSNNMGLLKTKINEGNDNDILEPDGRMKTAGRLVDVARQDVQNILIQQNTLYMIGTMTIATLLITAILISKK
jgi:Mg2+/Co2+ transporter CorC